jgi:hypothetical protein
MAFSLLTADGTYDRAAILREALGLHHRSRGTFWAPSFTLSYCLRGTWERARRQQARRRAAAAHDLLFELLREAFGPGPEACDLSNPSASW